MLRGSQPILIKMEDHLLCMLDYSHTLSPGTYISLSLPNDVLAVYAKPPQQSEQCDYTLIAMALRKPQWSMTRACEWLVRYGVASQQDACDEEKPMIPVISS